MDIIIFHAFFSEINLLQSDTVPLSWIYSCLKRHLILMLLTTVYWYKLALGSELLVIFPVHER